MLERYLPAIVVSAIYMPLRSMVAKLMAVGINNKLNSMTGEGEEDKKNEKEADGSDSDEPKTYEVDDDGNERRGRAKKRG